MRTLPALAIVALMTACQRTPEQQQADLFRNDAQQRGSALENQAETKPAAYSSKLKLSKLKPSRMAGSRGKG